MNYSWVMSMAPKNNYRVFRQQVVELRLLGASWDDISRITGRKPQWCRQVCSHKKQREYRATLRERVAQAVATARAKQITDSLSPQHSPQVRAAYTRAVAAQTLALATDRGPAQEALEAWMARVSGVPVDPGVCPLCGAARADVMDAIEGDNGAIEGDNGPIEGGTGQCDR